MTLKRNIPPKVWGVDRVEYIEPSRHRLTNGVELFVMNSGDQEVVKIDFSFKAGSWYGNSRLDSTMAASMLQEGTTKHKASEIANIFDFYGAQFSSASSYDNNYVSLLSLKKYLPQLLPMVSEIIREASFPEEEFEILRQKKKQRAIVDADRVGLIAQKSFLRNLFGEGHPYAPVASPEFYDTISLDGVKSHYNSFYLPGRMTITASGFVDTEVIQLIEDNFSASWGISNPLDNLNNHQLPIAEKTVFIEKEGANQNAVAIGKLFPTQNHPDYPGLKLLCTILGGYFGSRLMSNIREDKGYTYSIHASPISFLHNGVFLVFAEVKTDKTDATVNEIFREIQKLIGELISEEELIPIQNYMLGRILEDFDGPFARAHTFTSLRDVNMDFEYYNKLINTINTTTPVAIRELARKYLIPESMSTIIAGTR
ncbi:MAG: pitrilysin family protein [Bacteroidia bacterium]|nr:pitrilysin family protein [Bacteroidia bacterium]